MVRFNNLIYLLLTLKTKEFNDFFKAGFLLILGVALTNLISVFINTPRLVSYKALAIGAFLLLVLYWYLKAKVIDVDWELIRDSKNRAKEKKAAQPAVATVSLEKTKEPVATNEEIQKVVVPTETFNFATTLNATYDGGTKEDLAEAASQSTVSKVRRMDKMNLR